MLRPMYSPMSAGRRMSTCEAGRKTGTPMSTSRPPLILRVTLPETGSPSFLDSMILFQPVMRSALRLEITPGRCRIPPVRAGLDVVADFDVGHFLGIPFAREREDAFGLEADFDDDVVAVDVDDFAFENGAVSEGGTGGIQEGADFLGVVLAVKFLFDGGVGLSFVEARVLYKCVINHGGRTFRFKRRTFPPAAERLEPAENTAPIAWQAHRGRRRKSLLATQSGRGQV